jgi:shikimate kinase/3-dehydroquinate synthase
VIVLIGFMGAGKSAAARELAGAVGAAARDADRVLEERLGMPIADFFARHGEGEFRRREETVVLELLDGPPDGVVALGGGAVESERVRTALRRHRTVLLEVDVATAWARAHRSERPLARDRDAFVARYEQRRGLYEQLADVVLPQADRGVVRRALPAVRALPAGARMAWARAASGEYPVAVGPGVLEASWPVGGRRFAVSDEIVAPLYADRVRPHAVVTVPPGEPHKTLATAERVWRALAEAGMARDDHVCAVGGGVVGDLAGFCAATYQRGVPVVQAPTTLVAQVDSALGGKTGVDLPEGKNYVGAYHQPAAVLADPATLATLPAAERAAGYAEVVKTALIAGGALWERVAAGAEVDEDVVFACARTKLAVVAADERDGGRRQVLNLGHTVAHALETVTGYRRLRHGEAVGLGLLAALRLSGRDDLRAQVRELLAAQGLPVALDGLDAGAVVAATRRDKKRIGGVVPFVLVERPGDVRPGHAVEDADLRAAVEELAAR